MGFSATGNWRPLPIFSWTQDIFLPAETGWNQTSDSQTAWRARQRQSWRPVTNPASGLRRTWSAAIRACARNIPIGYCMIFRETSYVHGPVITNQSLGDIATPNSMCWTPVIRTQWHISNACLKQCMLGDTHCLRRIFSPGVCRIPQKCAVMRRERRPLLIS